jgi:uncharacterized membrane protein
MIRQTFLLALITLVPALELRASIPWGILGNESWGIADGLMPWYVVMLICMAVNIVLGIGVFWVLAPIMKWLERFRWFSRWIEPIMLRTQRKLHPYVEKYGEIGVGLFIGIPLPGSGVYTGALGAFVLGLDRRKFLVANVIGVVIAGIAVTTLSLLVKAGTAVPWLDFFLKH